MTALPDRMRPPCEEGWFAEDLDRLPEAPRHTELIDGALVFMLSPQRSWHGLLVTSLTTTLMATAPAGLEAEREMTIRLDERNRPEPDLLVTTAPYDPNRTWYAPEEVRLVIEVVSPESAHRDRTVKLQKYDFRPDWEARLGGACSYVDRSAVADFARRLAASAALVSGTDPHAQKR